MCGRFFNHLQEMHNWVDIIGDWPNDFETGYNISPSAMVPIVTQGGVCLARWGLVPPWAKEFGGKYPTHNARVETVQEKASYKGAWQNGQTCLVPVAGYYEWVKENGIKQPYVVHIPNDIVVMAGLWDAWEDKLSFTIITQDSQDTLEEIHHRMPVILNPAEAKRWLRDEPSTTSLESMQYAQASYYRVSTNVNKASATGLALIESID